MRQAGKRRIYFVVIQFWAANSPWVKNKQTNKQTNKRGSQFRAVLNFRKFKVALNPLPQYSFKLGKKFHFNILIHNSMKKIGSSNLFLTYKLLNLWRCWRVVLVHARDTIIVSCWCCSYFHYQENDYSLFTTNGWAFGWCHYCSVNRNRVTVLIYQSRKQAGN